MTEEKNKGGRPRSAGYGRSRAISDKLAAEGNTPLEVMVRVMKEFLADASAVKLEGFDDTADGKKALKEAKSERRVLLNQAVAVAKDAAPFIHARLSTVAVEGTEDGPPVRTQNVPLTKDELVAELLARGLPVPDIES